MIDRRGFIRTSLVTSALSLAQIPLVGTASARAEAAYPVLDHFLLDRRYPQAGLLKHTFSKQQLPLLDVDGDMTDLWINHFSPAWRHAPMTLAGVTGADVLFVLETLAMDHRMRLVHKTTLAPSLSLPGGGTMAFQHWIIGPKSLSA